MSPLLAAAPAAADLRSAPRYLRRLLRQRPLLTFTAGLLGTLWMLSYALLPPAIGYALDHGVIRRDPSAAVVGSALIVALAALQAASTIARHRTVVHLWLHGSFSTMGWVAQQASAHPRELAAQVGTGEAMASATEDADRVGGVLEMSGRGTGAFVSVLVIAVASLRIDLRMGLVVVLGIPLLGFGLAWLVRPLKARQEASRDLEGHLTGLTSDTVSGLRTLRGFGGQQQFVQRYAAANVAMRQAEMRLTGWQATVEVGQTALPLIFVTIMLWLGSEAVLSGRISTGQLLTLSGYAMFLFVPLATGVEMLGKVIQARVAVTKVISLLKVGPADPTMPEPAGPVELTGPGHPQAWQPTAPGVYGVVTAAGRGEAVTAALASTLPGEVLLSPSDAALFAGTLRRAVDPHERHSDAQIHASLAAAAAHDVLEGLQGGLEAELSERGRSVSGGQRQRIALARALLTRPDVLILAEPTSAVDAHTQAAIAAALPSACPGVVVLVITDDPVLLEALAEVFFLTASGPRRGSHHDLMAAPDYRAALGMES